MPDLVAFLILHKARERNPQIQIIILVIPILLSHTYLVWLYFNHLETTYFPLHITTMGEQVASCEAGQQAVFDGLKHHFGAQRLGTELTMFENIRKAHPDFHVTCADPSKSDLFGYAEAGHAEMIQDTGELFDVTRVYVAPVPRREGFGTLRDNTRFSRWKMIWKKSEYIIYAVKWTEYMSPFRVYYVLFPRKPDDTKTSKSTDDLLLAVGAWTTELHEEIYVFDDAHVCNFLHLLAYHT